MFWIPPSCIDIFLEFIWKHNMPSIAPQNKKNGIAADWEDKELTFGEFKHRGPIVLKGDETNLPKGRRSGGKSVCVQWKARINNIL